MKYGIPGGQGPWFCCLIFNTSEQGKKKTHLIAHTLPHLAVDVLNKKHQKSKEREHCWIMLMKIGPFERWSYALHFLHIWINTSRGKFRRIERGLELFSIYSFEYNLQIWAIKETQNEAKDRFFNHTFSNMPLIAYDPSFVVAALPEEEEDEEEENEEEQQPEEQTQQDGFLILLRELFVDQNGVIVQKIKDAQIALEKNNGPKKKQKIK